MYTAASPDPAASLIRAGVVPPCIGNATYYQADLLVTCAPPERGRTYPVDPVPIVEVLSPSTADHDGGRKVEDYSRLPSVEEILLVSSEERRVRPWRRDVPPLDRRGPDRRSRTPPAHRPHPDPARRHL